MKNLNKKELIITTAITIAVLLFEFFTLYDFNIKNIKISLEWNLENQYLFFIFIALSYLPAFVIGYFRTNPLWAFIPSFLINGFFWFLIIIRFYRLNIEILKVDPKLLMSSIGLSLMAGVSSILIAYISKKTFDMHLNKKAPAEPLKETEEAQA